MSSIAALAARLVTGQPWSHRIPWRVHALVDRIRQADSRSRAAPPRWTLRDAAPAATLLVGGDLALHRWEAGDAPGRVFGAVRDLFRDADLRVLNLETPLTDHATPSGAIGRFLRAAPGSIDVLQYLGVDVVSLANNHALDYGPDGFAACLEALHAADIASCGTHLVHEPTGIPGAVVRSLDGVRVGLLAATDHFGGMRAHDARGPVLLDVAALRRQATALREHCDVLMIQLHWGYEHVMYPLRWHRDVARQLVDDGAHLVCCHHAHVVMGAERWGNGIIAHGLGNFWFGSRGASHPASRFGMLLRATVDMHGVIAAELVPVHADDSFCMHVDERCVPSFDRLCDALHADRVLDAVERSRREVELAALLADITARQEAGDLDGLRERQHYLRAPRHDWLLADAPMTPMSPMTSMTPGEPWRGVAAWLDAFRRAELTAPVPSIPDLPPHAANCMRFADTRRLRGRWP